jgi:hypothetical protein
MAGLNGTCDPGRLEGVDAPTHLGDVGVCQDKGEFMGIRRPLVAEWPLCELLRSFVSRSGRAGVHRLCKVL